MRMPEVQDIFEQYAEEFRQKHPLTVVQHKAMNAILNCRTARLGGHLDSCPKCGYQRPSYNSCKHYMEIANIQQILFPKSGGLTLEKRICWMLAISM